MKRRSGCFITNCVMFAFLQFVVMFAISVNRNARNCKNRKICKVCKKRHPASLHGYKAEKSKVKQPHGNSSKDQK